MRIYMDEGKNTLKQVVCKGNQQFGYFSNKDGIRHSFDLCEECYDKLIEGFAVEVTKEEVQELL